MLRILFSLLFIKYIFFWFYRSVGLEATTYGGPQVHTKFKSLTLYSNHSRRIQIAHTKNQIFTPNSKTLAPNSNHPHQKSNLHTEFKNTRTKYKSLTPKIKSSHRIQITHTEFKNTRTKFKSLTPNSNHSHRINTFGQRSGLPAS